MVVCGCWANGGISGEDGSGIEGVVAGAFPGSGAYGCGATGYVGAAAFCRVASAVSGGGDPEWDGDEGVFAGALVCAAAGWVVGEWRGGDGAGGCAAI